MSEPRRKLLQVAGRGYTAGAVFVETEPGQGKVESCAPILTWMRAYDWPTIRQRLQAQGATWQWLDCPAGHDAGIALWRHSIDGAAKAEKRQAAIVRNVRKAK